MRKAVAVPYVIALILGVAVISLLGIWFVVTGGKFSKESLTNECRNAVLKYCIRLLNGEQIGLTYAGECRSISETGIFNNPLPSDISTCKSQGWIPS